MVIECEFAQGVPKLASLQCIAQFRLLTGYLHVKLYSCIVRLFSVAYGKGLRPLLCFEAISKRN